MEPARNLRGKVESGFSHVTIQLEGHESTPFKVQGYVKEKFRLGNLFRYFINFFRGEKKGEKKFVPLQVGDQTVLLKVSDLAKNLYLSESQVRNTPQLVELLEKRLDSSAFAKKNIEVLTRKKQQITGIKKSELNARTINKIASVIFHAHLAAERKPASSKTPVHQLVKITNKISLVAEDSPEGLRISTIFGEKVGSGSYGTAVRTFNLFGNEEGRRVAKLPSAAKEATEQIKNEVKVIQALNPDGKACGIQKPLILGEGFHVGVEYDSDLFEAIYNTDEGVNREMMLPVAFQLMEGLTTIHEKGYSHADIKPNNIFYDKPDENRGSRVYIGDFGGALNHNDSKLRDLGDRDFQNLANKRNRTPNYYPEFDVSFLIQAAKPSSIERYKKIEQSIDVFAMCSTIIEMVIRRPLSLIDQTNPNYKTELVSKLMEFGGFNEESAKLIINGLNKIYDRRPAAKEIRDALRKAMAVPDYAFLPNLNQNQVEERLNQQPIGTYLLTKGDNRSIKVTVRLKDSFVSESFEGSQPYEIKEHLNALRERLQIQTEHFIPFDTSLL